jgi:Flp pilus assembly secretin CpaC
MPAYATKHEHMKTLLSSIAIFVFTAVVLLAGQAPTPTNGATTPETVDSTFARQNINSNVTSIVGGVSADSNFRAVLNALEERNGATSVTEPRVATMRGVYANWLGGLNFSIPEPLEPAEFSNTNGDELFMRTFELNTNALSCLLQNRSGLVTNDIATSAKSFSSKLGIDWESPRDDIATSMKSVSSTMGVDWESPRGKKVFYKDRLGLLFVRATESDLELVERAIAALNQPPPQIRIKSLFWEVPEGTLDGLKELLVLTNSKGGMLAGVLNNRNANTTLLALQHRPGAELLAEREATITSGWQFEMRATHSITAGTNLTFPGSWANQKKVLGTNAILTQTGKYEIGPILVVVPYLLADGLTINLSLIPSLPEFTGYRISTKSTATFDKAAHQTEVTEIRPGFRFRQSVADLNLWDGQTAVMGVFTNSLWMGGTEDTKPGKFGKMELLVFVTGTLVDSTDHRIHSDEELPFASDSIPPQPPQTQNQN